MSSFCQGNALSIDLLVYARDGFEYQNNGMMILDNSYNIDDKAYSQFELGLSKYLVLSSKCMGEVSLFFCVFFIFIAELFDKHFLLDLNSHKQKETRNNHHD